MVLWGMRKTCREERRDVGLARPVSAAQSPAPKDDPSGPGSFGRQREFGTPRPHTGLAQCISLYRTSFRCCGAGTVKRRRCCKPTQTSAH